MEQHSQSDLPNNLSPADQSYQPNKAYSYLMMAGHICCDMSLSTIPALLPFLVSYRGIDYAAAAGLTFASSSLSSLIQPLFGMIADYRQMPWLMALGILMTGLGISSIGFLESYWGIFAVITFAGFGSAIFHPEGGRMANCVGGNQKGRAMSIFTAGGNIGFVIGPIVTTFSVSNWGLKGTAIMLIPTAVMVAILISQGKKLQHISDTARREVREKVAISGQKDDWGAFTRLTSSIFLRSIVQNGLSTFIPLYWISVLMQTQQRGSLMVTVIAFASMVAAFTGGRLADHFGFRRVICTSFAMVAPLFILLLLIKDVWLATAIIIPLAVMLPLGHSPSVVLGQKYLPNRVGLASGVTLGLAISMGGICSPLLGKIGDNFGLTTVLYVVAGVALIGFLSTLLIKE
ncbi:MAG: MFS transporter [Peptococcaceae bacterium]|jgi:FSR family fosmidomycin resistance protein-like MFS transporter|nr:MFS transporter [Peptococcaceae bacterium]